MSLSFGAASALSLILAMVACSSSEPGLPVEVDEGPFCLLGTLPFTPSTVEWQDERNENLAQSHPRIKHQPADILSNGEVHAYTDLSGSSPLASGAYVLRGIMARTKESQGLVYQPVDGEYVSVWRQIEGIWVTEGETLTHEGDPSGQYELDLGFAAIEGEVSHHYAVLDAERSCGRHSIYELEPGRQIVLTDIDETITISDDEIFLQIEDEAYDQVEMPYSVEMTQAWASKGYQVVYLTARPHLFRAETRAWLKTHGYADGPVITAPSLVLGETARVYKREWVSRLLNELGWEIVAAYGNSESDIDAYEDAGIDKAISFIIGESAGIKGTSVIENETYAAHIENYIEAQPDAR